MRAETSGQQAVFLWVHALVGVLLNVGDRLQQQPRYRHDASDKCDRPQ